MARLGNIIRQTEVKFDTHDQEQWFQPVKVTAIVVDVW